MTFWVVNPKIIECLDSLEKLMPMLRAEREKCAYFYTFYRVIFYLQYIDKWGKLTLYAEIFRRDAALYFDSVAENFSQYDICDFFVFTCRLICIACTDLHQINDEKLAQFDQMFLNAVNKYGCYADYWEYRLQLALLYRNRQMAEEAMTMLQKYTTRDC